ncbi:nicotinamide-nucleotide amidase [Arcanobacterium pluranimalium]|uniref:CinA family protein n=1 Tax=Arcanobacterium pluranimalium TaxID=108028 RepID=UPI00195B6EAE|nr:CinA family protein [Arcanobacterium pluranimalium]MBM7825625.1 nicotinamide-nucleotide amidase [Arcanobacterium pluranimalium]
MSDDRIFLPEIDALLCAEKGVCEAGFDVREQSRSLAQQVLVQAQRFGVSIACAESLTGGRLADAFVSVPGASAVFRGSAVTYASEAKAQILGVDSDLLKSRGAVDAVVAMQMAAGASRIYCADFSIATTGVAGPGPAEGKPAGTVFIGIKTPDRRAYWQGSISGNRKYVRDVTVWVGLKALSAEFQGNGKFFS